MSACIFCRVAAKEFDTPFLHNDDELVAFHDLNPQAPVHILVIPRRHLPTLLDTGDADVALLGRMQRVAIELARQHGLAESGFRLVTNCLADAGQTVFHLHLHLLGGRSLKWPPG